jgi:hypothetical protein
MDDAFITCYKIKQYETSANRSLGHHIATNSISFCFIQSMIGSQNPMEPTIEQDNPHSTLQNITMLTYNPANQTISSILETPTCCKQKRNMEEADLIASFATHVLPRKRNILRRFFVNTNCDSSE